MERKYLQKKITFNPKGDPSTLLNTIRVYSNKILSPKENDRGKWWISEIYRDPRNASIYLYDVIEAPLDDEEPAQPEADFPVVARLMAWARGDGYSHLVIEYDEILSGWIIDIDKYINTFKFPDDSKYKKPIEPVKPPTVKSGTELDIWFDWYHEMKINGFKCTLNDIAKENEYSYGYVRQLHPEYKRKRGLT